MSSIVPSPDWFVGVDSLTLCSNDRWIDKITVEAKPFDAGFESGLTFTAPVWQTEPQGLVKPITSSEPNHEAASFFYPELDELPPLGFFHFQKMQEFVTVDKDQLKQICATNNYGPSLDFDFENTIDDDYTESTTSTTTSYTRPIKRRVPHRDVGSIKYASPDCQVTEWTAWSNCSKSCGLGESFRTRQVLRQPKRGGMPCPALKQISWCGSERTCNTNENYFRW